MSFAKSNILKNELISKKSLRIKLLGDSITHGFGGTGYSPTDEHIVDEFYRNNKGYCWANSFRDYMKDKFNCTVINNGCSGTTIEFIIDNFDILVDDEDDFIICTIGTNNRHFYFSAGEKPEREAFGTNIYNNIIKLYDKFKSANKQVVFIANIPAAADRELDSDEFWRILHMDDINNIYKKASENCGLPLISLYDLFSQYCQTNNIIVDSLLSDGLHPNDDGYDVMFKLITEALELEQ